MSAILPEAEQDDLPTGFSIVGHVGASALYFVQQKESQKDKIKSRAFDRLNN